jgi:2-keto-4-pentenoate hydratase/2-oxohepta-3-ene-1,7-dioic acid hydratase in catechol pathway
LVKLVSYREQDETRLGVTQAGKIVNLSAAARRFAETTGREVPESAFASMADLLTASDGALETAGGITAWALEHAPDVIVDLETAEIDIPLVNPGKIICIGLNYADHCRETNTPVPDSPVLFTKFTTSMLPHGGEISWLPEMTQKVDYEAELAVIIGRKAARVAEEEAMNYVAGYTIVNDVSARDVQFSDGQWIRGKSFDTFCPIGPFVVTADTLLDPHALDIQCRVNGITLQDSNTGEMIFKIPYLISYISHSSTLLPGDIISTGTPHGVGIGHDPQVLLKSGDKVEVEVEGIGILINTVK